VQRPSCRQIKITPPPRFRLEDGECFIIGGGGLGGSPLPARPTRSDPLLVSSGGCSPFFSDASHERQFRLVPAWQHPASAGAAHLLSTHYCHGSASSNCLSLCVFIGSAHIEHDNTRFGITPWNRLYSLGVELPMKAREAPATLLHPERICSTIVLSRCSATWYVCTASLSSLTTRQFSFASAAIASRVRTNSCNLFLHEIPCRRSPNHCSRSRALPFELLVHQCGRQGF